MQLRVLSDDDLDRIQKATLTVMEKTGLWFVDCPQAHEIFLSAGCQVANGRVRFPPGVIADTLSKVADRRTIFPFFPTLGYAEPLSVKQGETHFGLIGNAFYIYDYDSESSRSCIETDIEDKLLILDSLSNIEYDCCNLFTAFERGIGPAMVSSYDTVAACTGFLREWVSARSFSGRKKLPLGTRNCQLEEERLTVLGHAILEGTAATETILKDGSGFPWVNPQSPLQYKASEAVAIIESARNGAWNQVSPEVMMGGSGPVTLAGALVQHNAEVLGGLVLAQLSQPGSPYIYGCVSAPMDLRNAEISQGSFETALFNAAVVQIADSYGLPTRISPGNTSAQQPGPRALAEATLGLYMGAAAGGNLITTGLLDSTLMVSFEHLVALDETINQIRSITGSISTDVDSLALDAIAEFGHPDGNYFGADHTMQFMKRDVYYSDFTGRIKASYEDTYAKAHSRVQETLARKQTSSHLEKSTLEHLAAVEARLEEDDRAWREGRDDWWQFYLQDLGC
jgi:trimethylamine---corrinoid protein Co-methyltransferase